MKKNVLINAGWAAATFTSFVIGSQFFGANSPSSIAESNRASKQESSLHSQDRASNAADQNVTPHKRSLTASQGNLNEADLKNLGDQLRAAKGPLERRAVFSKVLEVLTPENAKQLREQILHLGERDSSFREFHYAWGAMAGQEAVAFGTDSPERDASATFAGWMSADPDAALAYFRNLPTDQQNGNRALKWGAASGLADVDPARAIEFAAEQFKNGDRDARRMVSMALDSAIQSGDIANATSLIRNLPEGELNEVAHRHLFRNLAQSDPENALQLAKDLPSGESKNDAVQTSFYTWAGKNPVEAAAEINNFSNTNERDAATYGYATRVVLDDPATGVEWAATIQNSESRQRALVQTGRVYYRRDREAAKTWLAASGLTVEQQKLVTQGRRNRR